eukprot:SRR837773.7798.p3 GENE.SRR837773.7798~~SRR837773.7798.p3  ORF type:complete len:143 (-),score=32.96 SRR837773.7798:11-439(-)
MSMGLWNAGPKKESQAPEIVLQRVEKVYAAELKQAQRGGDSMIMDVSVCPTLPPMERHSVNSDLDSPGVRGEGVGRRRADDRFKVAAKWTLTVGSLSTKDAIKQFTSPEGALEATNGTAAGRNRTACRIPCRRPTSTLGGGT